MSEIQENGQTSIEAFNKSVSGFSKKSRLATLLFCLFLGTFGIHRFYVGKVGTGIIMICLCWTGIASIWALIDLILIVSGSFKDKDGLKIVDWQIS